MFHTLLDRFFVVLGAFLGSQFPQFMQQYNQRLSGHVDELHRTLLRLEEMAIQSGVPLQLYIKKFSEQSDVTISRQGSFMQDLVLRFQDLNESFTTLNASTVWSRPYFFMKYLDLEIGKATFHHYSPGLTFDTEVCIYVLLGGFLGWGLYHCLSLLLPMQKMHFIGSR